MTVSETINQMIRSVIMSSTWTSAGKIETVDNFIKDPRGFENPDLESEIKDLSSSEGGDKGGKPSDVTVLKKRFKKLDEGNVGEVTRMTSQQFGNIKAFALNPAGFLIGSVMRKAFKGAGVLILVTLIFDAVKFIISELLKPGRLLDIRFKRDVRRELMFFRLREQQQKLRQGFSRIIVTTMPGLRGGQNQTGDSFAPLARGDFEIVGDDSAAAPYQLAEPQGDPVSLSKSYGRTGRFGRR